MLPDLSFTYENAACGLVTTEINGTIRRANATFCKWLGFAASEMIDKKRIQELFTVGGRFFHHTHLAPLLQMQGSVAEIQIDLIGQNGVAIPMLINAIRHKQGEQRFDEFAFMVATDRKVYERELISARKTAEETLQSLYEAQKELHESRDILSIAIQSARMGVWSENLQTNEVWWSLELEQLTGFIGKKFGDTHEDFYGLIHPEDRIVFATELKKAADTKSNYEVQFRLQHANRNWLTMEGRGHAVYSESGEVLSIFGIVIDISDRKAAEQQLHELNKQLSISDRRKDEFLATLAHELRNPLAPMRNVLEIMRLKEKDNPFIHWSRDIIERHVSQMTHLVDDLMEASRISQGRLQLRKKQIDLCEVTLHAVETSQAVILDSKHNFKMNIPDSPLTIEADSTRIIQIISNLLTNAAKYTPPGGDIYLNLSHNGDEALLSVRDTGIGIPPEQLSNIFTMFSQLKPALERSQGGLGIGLSLVRGLVELHGGSIVAFSEGDGKGSEFIVRLPLSATQNDRTRTIAPKSITPLETTSMNNKRILVVDDNVDAAQSLALLLEMSGHITRSVNNGITGVAAAEEFLPDVILLDIGLPDINGYEVARRIRQKPWGKNIFLIAATGWGQHKDKELAKAAGFDKHLTKPIDYQTLNRLLEKAPYQA
ncbi:MAG: hybrid sensor histidine kinase/response regulator [Cellvibrio sp. 79]|nr:MAG: hybrid sensor histidine kinase/response regulator [Cellvibrio sp. 79]